MDKPDTWNSISAVFETFQTLSKVTKGSAPKSDGFSKSDKFSDQIGNHTDSSQNHNLNQNENTSDERISNDTCLFGGGRGKLLENLQKQYARQQLDETIHNELKVIFGTGFSNEAIENHFASVCSSSSEPSKQEIGVFSDCYSEDDEQEVDFVVGESNIMKKINAHEKYSAMMRKKKAPRCRNAIVLSFTQKTSTETEQNTKKIPDLKGPDLFLPNKSYSTIVSAASSSSFKQGDGPIFNDDDFPAL